MEPMKSRFGWALSFMVALVILATGLCVFDQSHDAMSDHGMSLVFSLAIPLLAWPGVNGWYRPVLVRSSCVNRVRALDPPPKS